MTLEAGYFKLFLDIWISDILQSGILGMKTLSSSTNQLLLKNITLVRESPMIVLHTTLQINTKEDGLCALSMLKYEYLRFDKKAKNNIFLVISTSLFIFSILYNKSELSVGFHVPIFLGGLFA